MSMTATANDSHRPDDPRGHFNLAVCLETLKDESGALAEFETAFELAPTMANAGANAAGLLIRAGEAERASALCYAVRLVCIANCCSMDA